MRRVYRSGESEYLVNGRDCPAEGHPRTLLGHRRRHRGLQRDRAGPRRCAADGLRPRSTRGLRGGGRHHPVSQPAEPRPSGGWSGPSRTASGWPTSSGEVSARLETVRRQAARARRWRTLTERLKTLRIVAASRDLAGVDAERRRPLKTALAADRRQLSAADERAAAVATELATLAAAAGELSEELAGRRATAATASQREAAAAARHESLRSRRPEVERELARVAEVAVRVRQEARAAQVDAEAAEAAADRAVAAVTDIETRLGDTEHLAAGSNGHSEAARAALARAEVDRDAARQRVSNSKRRPNRPPPEPPNSWRQSIPPATRPPPRQHVGTVSTKDGRPPRAIGNLSRPVSVPLDATRKRRNTRTARPPRPFRRPGATSPTRGRLPRPAGSVAMSSTTWSVGRKAFPRRPAACSGRVRIACQGCRAWWPTGWWYRWSGRRWSISPWPTRPEPPGELAGDGLGLACGAPQPRAVAG